MGATIFSLFIIGNLIGGNYLGKAEPNIISPNIGKIYFVINSTNINNVNDGQNIVSSNIKSFVKITNNDNKTMIVEYTPYVMFEQKHVYNLTKYTFRLNPFTSENVTNYFPLEHQGVNYLMHDFTTYAPGEYSGSPTEYWQMYGTMTQEMYYNQYYQAIVYRFIFLPAIPLVIIAIKQVADVWYKRYPFDDDEEDD